VGCRLVVQVFGVAGSPCRGGRFALHEAALSSVRGEGCGEVEVVCLCDVELKPCGGCSGYCEAAGKCKIEDGMQGLYPKLKEADVIVIATPTYFWNVSGLTKNFMDRTLPLYYHGMLKGKLGAAIALAAINGQERTLAALNHFFELHEVKQIGGIAIALHEKKTVGKAELEMAKALGRKILTH